MGKNFREALSKFWPGLGKFDSAREMHPSNAFQMPQWLVKRLSRRPKQRNYYGWTYKGRKGVPTRFGVRHYFSRKVILEGPFGGSEKKQEIKIAIYLQPVSEKKSKHPFVNVKVNGPYYTRSARLPSGRGGARVFYNQRLVPDFKPDLKRTVEAFLRAMDLDHKTESGINQSGNQLHTAQATQQLQKP